MMIKRTKTELIEAYKTIPTGNISDAMDILGLPRGIVQGLKPITMGQARIAGWAYTVKQMQRHSESEGKVLTRHPEVIDQLAAPGDVVVVDVGGRLDVCTGGAILALRAKLRGISGFIIDGCFRDIQEIIDIRFPVHSRGISPIKSSPDLETVGVNIPVNIGGVHIRPGDLIVADDTGIVVISPQNADKVLQVSLEIKHKEEKIIEYIRAGFTISDAVTKSEADLTSEADCQK